MVDVVGAGVVVLLLLVLLLEVLATAVVVLDDDDGKAVVLELLDVVGAGVVVLVLLLVLVGGAMLVLLDVIGIEQLVPVKPSSHSHLPPPRHRPFPEHVFIGLH